MRIAKVLLAIILLTNCWLGIAISAPNKSFENVFLKHGMPMLKTYAIAQESNGIIWIATDKGLFRYDAYSFENFNTFFENNKIAISSIQALYIDRSNNLWISTAHTGLIKYSINTKTVFSFVNSKSNTASISSNNVAQVVEDTKGNIWVATNAGLDCISFKTNVPKFIHFNNSVDNVQSLCNNHVLSLCADTKGYVWAGTKSGLSVINIESLQIVNFLNNYELGIYAVSSIYTDKDGSFFVGTQNGLFQFSNFDLYGLKSTELKSKNGVITNISSITCDKDKNIWVSTFGNGIIVLNNITKEESSNSVANIDNTINQINQVYLDKTGVLFAATQLGLYQLNTSKTFINYDFSFLQENPISNPAIYAVLEDKNKIIWLGTENHGLIRYNPANNKINRFNAEIKGKQCLTNNEVYSLLEKENYILAGTRNGLNIINKSSLDVKQIASENGRLDINTMFEDENKQIWLGLMGGGLGRFNEMTQQVDIFPYSIDLDVKAIVNSDGGELWLGTNLGLKRFNTVDMSYLHPTIKTVLEIDLKNLVINALCNNQNYLWIGTDQNGLLKLNLKNNELLAVDKNTLFSYSEIYAISTDQLNNIWYTTNQGLYQYSIAKNTFRKFDESYGLPIQNFNEGACYKTSYNKIILGGQNYVSTFYPDSLSSNANMFPILFKSIYNSRIETEIEKTGKAAFYAKMDYTNNSFSINFLALNFLTPEKTQYAYKLEPYNKEWVNCGTNHLATFTNLSSGTYVFKIRVTAQNGEWLTYPDSITIKISPPYWATWWFRCIVFFFIISVIIIALKIRSRNLKQQRAKELAQNSEILKQQFLANMSHEIRTPMNAVIGFSELLAHTPLGTEQHKYLSAIKNSADNLLLIINDLLDFSKLDSGNLELKKTNFNITHLIEKLHAEMEEKAKQKNLVFKSQVFTNVPEFLFGDENRIMQILINLLNNAIKFTEKGWVSISVEKIAVIDNVAQLRFKINDTGIGIEKSQLKSIFELFTKLPNSKEKLYGGTGIGLTITHKLVSFLKGTIEVDSQLNHGSLFTINLPIEISTNEDNKEIAKNKGSVMITSLESIETKDKVTNASNPTFEINTSSKPTPAKPINSSHSNITNALCILIAEDNAFNQLLITKVISKYLPQATFIVVNNGKEVLEKLQQIAFDIILMDVQMPEMDGIEATKQIRMSQHTDYCTIPIMACTAGVTVDEIQKCYDSGMDEFISKPFQPEELVKKILLMLEKNSKTGTYVKPSGL
jgi:signal transduction histidine kinase/ligand-binding sensor domain-containing protein/CheY-like chemotaxis protein